MEKELENSGLTKQDWSNFKFGEDTSLNGIGYSLAGFVFFVTRGAISRV